MAQVMSSRTEEPRDDFHAERNDGLRRYAEAFELNRNPVNDCEQGVIAEAMNRMVKDTFGEQQKKATNIWDFVSAIPADRIYIVHKIGSGTYSKVYLAMVNRTHKVALKWVNVKDLPVNIREKFLAREVEVWKKLSHPNILALFSVLHFPHSIGMFCEPSSYGDMLQVLLGMGPTINILQRALWLSQIVKAVDYMHSKGIAHRDLKCENCLYFKNDVIKVSDFGFCVEARQRAELSRTHCGSRAYSAPELVRGEPYDVFKADVWAIGCITAVVLNYEMPFPDSVEITNSQFIQQLDRRILIARPDYYYGRICQFTLDSLLVHDYRHRPDMGNVMLLRLWRRLTTSSMEHLQLRDWLYKYGIL